MHPYRPDTPNIVPASDTGPASDAGPASDIVLSADIVTSAEGVTPASSSPSESPSESSEVSVSIRGERVGFGYENPLPARQRDRNRDSKGSLSQSVLFLMTVALLFAALRYLLPVVVEEARYAWHRGELRAEYEVSGEGLRTASLDSLSQASQMVTQHVGPSVVHIEVQRQRTSQQVDLANFLQEQKGLPPSMGPLLSSDQGSGVIVDASGYILTNEHVIAGGASIQVGLSDGQRVPAVVVGVDPLTDLAVLKIDATNLIPIEFGESDAAKVGSPVWAVGSPFGLDRTVTFGILSGKHRVVKASTRYQDFMQSDVAVNPGNSGGPLVDARGQLIGINTAIVGDTYRGVSFSIPSNVAKSVYERIRADGHFQRGWLGVALAEVPDDLHKGADARVRGALVTGLADPDSPAARAGVLAGDIVLQLNEIELADIGHLMRLVGDLKVGESVQLLVRRDDGLQSLWVTIGSPPAERVLR
ncbi:putative periplasmic serine endoprotease DegP-like precursor [Roseimaritima multifibrata]|uniref:Putative periplasmic serine endoprotease DegP-like n=1 Tax=Roseimaritima multifibrata TaxID=1930274 RepID=A0A517MM53_9BACT|nr:trypsin-like peptidase domain-containing protein [Roseimaritima multifibrata]QDS95847.1 putative periplasmic serine endoprotease DegP-like precursor [Roseimaritima multifibrata]